MPFQPYWEKPLKKCIFTLNVDNYAPELTEITYPLIRRYADKIGATFHIIDERRYPGWPPVYEKLQIYRLAQEMGNDWNIYIDSDALVHPDLLDVTQLISKDTVMHNGNDFVGNVTVNANTILQLNGTTVIPDACRIFSL